MDLASAEAKDLNHDWIGVDHLVLGLLHPEAPGRAREVIESFGVVLPEARAALVDAMGDPFEPHDRGRVIPPATQLIVERANLQAVLLQDEKVDSEHILLAIADRWGALQLSRFLSAHGMDADGIRERILAPPRPRKATRRRAEAPSPRRQLAAMAAWSELDLRPTPSGRDPLVRRPWGSAVFEDASGRPVRRGVALLQYFIDRDGNPVLTKDGRPVHFLIDDGGRPVLDEEGAPRLTAVDIPPGSEVRAWPRGQRRGIADLTP